MYKNLFFDDQRLYKRENLRRSYAEPELAGVFHDSNISTCIESTYVFKTDDEKYRMLYQGKKADADGFSLFIAVSEDGLHFEPEDISSLLKLENRITLNELMKLPQDEIAYVVEDPFHGADERYKMLRTTCHGEEIYMEDSVWVSADLIHWSRLDGISWHNRGTEPCTGVFYNTARKCFTIVTRPSWGIRQVGIVETQDFRTFTDFELCMQCDSEDQPLAEVYGMTAHRYDGWYIGLPYIYGDLKGSDGAKFTGGTMKAQLAYSWDGKFWQRSLHTSFLDGEADYVKKVTGIGYKMVWPTYIIPKEDGLYLYAAATELEHGPAFSGTDGRADILIFRLRKDGVIKLETEDNTKSSVLKTRENIWQGGEIHLNLKAQRATVALSESDESAYTGGACKPIAGFGHEDCIPFSGDAVDWVPIFQSGKKTADLKGKTVSIEVKFEDGELYSISGDYIPVMNVEAAVYRKYGRLPECRNLYE